MKKTTLTLAFIAAMTGTPAHASVMDMFRDNRMDITTPTYPDVPNNGQLERIGFREMIEDGGIKTPYGTVKPFRHGLRITNEF